MKRVYLDANATTPLDPRVREEMAPWLDCGNASSPHAEGRAARSAIDTARERVAALVGAAPREIIFTSGATEANALALIGTIAARRCTRVFCSSVEHPSVLRTLEALRPGVELCLGAVDAVGRLRPGTEIPAATGLVSVMLANNETGTIQPVARFAGEARARGAVIHTDAVQACGKMAVDVGKLGIDLLTLSAHKMGGPKGAGALYVRRGSPPRPLFFGGEHERGLRPGTENVAAIVGLGSAARLARTELGQRRQAWLRLTAHFLERLPACVPGVRIHSPANEAERIPNTISMTIPGVEGEAVLLALDLEGIAIATGSACSSGAAEPSHVLRALGLSRVQAEQSVRISLHAGSTLDDVDVCLECLAGAVKKLRSLQV